eukprot:GFUD01024751.1.p1 GENE.GFUD01024751.1~~GFUD01024751.1.p1  ORF type:complete len:165 (+),score=38.58 GFUD01024751.1:41-535(+)
MRVFVTVGTTQFDSLVTRVCSQDIQSELLGLGYTSMVVQTGKFCPSPDSLSNTELELSWYDYKPSLSQDISSADLVISHAGAGTCIEVLEAGKPLIVIVNDQLMGNHQVELAERLALDSYLVCGTVSTLQETIEKFSQEKSNLQPYPKPDGTIFSSFLNQLMQV